MSNLHTPERLEGESIEDYKQRRAASKAVAKYMMHGMPLNVLKASRRGIRIRKHPRNGVPKFAKVRSHKPKKAIKATWPGSENQKLQSRPVIVIHPVRALRMKFLASNPADKNGFRMLTERQEFMIAYAMQSHKHFIDSRAA